MSHQLPALAPTLHVSLMKIYLAKHYSYRRWQALVGGTIAILFGAIPLFCFVIPGAFKADWHGSFNLSKLPGLLFIVGIPVLLLSAGLWVVHAWIIDRVNELVVSDIGVQYGSQFRKWEQIKWFSIHQIERGSPTLFYQKTGFSFDYNLMVTDPLSEDEISELFENLERDVAPLNKKLRIG